MTLLSLFQVPEKDGPIVVQVRLQAAHILEVHIRINILSSRNINQSQKKRRSQENQILTVGNK